MRTGRTEAVGGVVADGPRTRGLLVAYVPAGDPRADVLNRLDDYAAAGVDVLEIGIPSPDPYRDGPVIRASMQRALADGFDVDRWARELAAWRAGRSNPRVVWMCYPDSDLGRFAAHLEGGAADGLLAVDAERRGDHLALRQAVSDRPLGWCTFVGWASPGPPAHLGPDRNAYTMIQSRPGRTGASTHPGRHRERARAMLAGEVGRVRDLDLHAPVVVGFGLSERSHVAQVAAAGADGCVVGTALVERLLDRPDTLAEYLGGLRRAADAAFDPPPPDPQASS